MLHYFPNFFASAIPATSGTGNLWSQMFAGYQRVLDHSSQELWTSSARIIQEHAARAWIEASQSCMAALAENASAIQQRTFEKLLGAQQEAATIAAKEVTEALTGQ